MIIKFSKHLSLSDWQSTNDPVWHSGDDGSFGETIWYRKLIPYQDYDSTIIVNVRTIDANHWYVNFYSQLVFLHKYFPCNLPDGFEGDLDFAKNHVDNFLIRMSKLTAFF